MTSTSKSVSAIPPWPLFWPDWDMVVLVCTAPGTTLSDLLYPCLLATSKTQRCVCIHGSRYLHPLPEPSCTRTPIHSPLIPTVLIMLSKSALWLPQVMDHLPLRSPHHQMSCKPTPATEGHFCAASSLSAEGQEQHSPP